MAEIESKDMARLATALEDIAKALAMIAGKMPPTVINGGLGTSGSVGGCRYERPYSGPSGGLF